MTWSGLDQRSFPRLELQCDIWVFDNQETHIQTTTENVGGGGVCVILNRPLERFSMVKLKLILPSDFAREIEADGRVVWIVCSTNPATGKKSYDTGVEFVNLNEQDKKTLLNIVRMNTSPSEIL